MRLENEVQQLRQQVAHYETKEAAEHSLNGETTTAMKTCPICLKICRSIELLKEHKRIHETLNPSNRSR